MQWGWGKVEFKRGFPPISQKRKFIWINPRNTDLDNFRKKCTTRMNNDTRYSRTVLGNWVSVGINLEILTWTAYSWSRCLRCSCKYFSSTKSRLHIRHRKLLLWKKKENYNFLNTVRYQIKSMFWRLSMKHANASWND